MIRLETTTWGSLEIFHEDLLLTPADIVDTSWRHAEVARAEWGRHSVVITTGPYVGRLLIPGRCVIDVLELVPGTVETLLPLAYSGVRQAEEVGAAGIARLPAWITLLERYGELLYQYVRVGIDRRYLARRWETSIPRGRIDIGRTSRLHRARDRPHVLSCVVRELTEDTNFHRLLVSAAVRADRLLGVGQATPALGALRRSLLAFSGIPFEPSPDMFRARAELGPHADDAMLGLLELAELIVRGVSALPEDAVDREQPASVWINVDAIFEQALRKLVAERISLPVRSGRGDGVPLLRTGEPLAADPDIVVDYPQGPAILDAKYRRHGTEIARPELYQLMAHAIAYGARRAALITPRLTETDRDRFLGVDTNGCHYDVIAVDADSASALRRQLDAWLLRAGISADAHSTGTPDVTHRVSA